MNQSVPAARRHPAWLFAFAVLLLAASLAGIGQCGDEVFSWRQCAGQSIRVMLNVHPYSEGIKRRLDEFERLTGIHVAYVMLPEGKYFATLDQSFTSIAGRPDVYMIGVYQVWEYAHQGRIAPLDYFIQNPSLTRQGYRLDDFFPTILDAFRWNRRAGSKLGSGPLWAVPMGFEAAALTYNREVLARYRLPVPETMEQLLITGRALNHFEGPDTYGVAARGVGGWNSLHSGYITAFANYGAKDIEVENGRLVSKVNSPEAVAVTDLWVEMQKTCGPTGWEKSNWYRCLSDVGERKTALMFDSSTLGYFANAAGMSSQSGKLGLAPPPMPVDGDRDHIKSNLWIWGLAMNPDSPSLDASWLFMQYFTSREFQSYSVLEWNSLNPPRRSVYENPAFQNTMSTMYGYRETFDSILEDTAIHFTPTPLFFEISNRWADTIRDIAAGVYGSTQEGMDALKIWMDDKLEHVSAE